jgi:hypothetical protein
MWSYVFWTYVAGPVLAMLPERWRKALPMTGHVQWERAATLSGMCEMLLAIVALGYWYLYEMGRRMGQIMDLWEKGAAQVGLDEHQVSGAALTLFYMSPLTWILFFFFFEGAVRLCGAAFTENALGTTPLYLLARMIFLVKHREEVKPGDVVRRNASSFAESVREELLTVGRKELPDELHYDRNGTEETLEIWATRRKTEWVAPKIVRVDDVYYRLEEGTVENGARPFRYLLRRLEAGVPGRNVILYKSGEPGEKIS